MSGPLDDNRPMPDIVPVPDNLIDQSAFEKPFEEPAGTAALFISALEDPAENLRALRHLTTPESWPAWGDYSDAAAALNALGEDVGIGNKGDRPQPDVAYIVLARDLVKESSVYVLSETPVPVMVAAVISLVHRPSRGGWVVHAIGGAHVPPDELPRDT